MLSLDADYINLKAPYKVTEGEPNSFYFTTKHGIAYNVGFAQDYMLADEGVYQFYIVNIDRSHFYHDSDVKETIRCVIEAFFEQEPLVMLYICDMADQRQGIRSRLFIKWYEEYTQKQDFTMVNETISFDDIVYYGSIILRKDHPNHNDLVSRFHEVIQELPSKLSEM